MLDVMTQKILSPCARINSIESSDQVSALGFLAGFFRISEKTAETAILDSKWQMLLHTILVPCAWIKSIESSDQIYTSGFLVGILWILEKHP